MMAGPVQSGGVAAEDCRQFHDISWPKLVHKECLWMGACLHPPQDAIAKMTDDAQADAFVALLRACGKTKDLPRGTRLHDDILRKGLLEKCSDALVTMYAKCGALAKAKELLDMHKSMDVITWTALIAGYARARQGHSALDCFECMQRIGIHPNAVTYVYLLKACGTIGAADKGKQIHDEIARQGLLQDNIVLGTALVDMYAKCGALSKAHRVLAELPSRDVVTWNALISGYAQEGQGEQALNCFDCMQHERIPPSAVTFLCILKACGSIGALDKGKQIHDEITRQGLLQSNTMLGTALVDMYAKCGALLKAQSVLEGLPSRDVASWSALIVGYAQEGQSEQALSCFERMQQEGISPDAMTYASILKACGNLGTIDKGKQIHDKIVKEGLLQSDFVLGTALIDMYAKCGALSKAQSVLDELPHQNVASWNALIAGYVQGGQSDEALSCLECMQHEGLLPDAVTYIYILKACGTTGAADKGKQVHDKIVKQGLLHNNVVLGTALVDMYAKCGALSNAQHVLEGLPARDVAAWSALIAGYAQEGLAEQALSCFERMQHEGISPNAATYACILKACGTTGAAEKGKVIHDQIAQQGLLQNNVVLGTALVDMYAKCGAVGKARCVLEELPSRDVAAWNSMIAGYAQEGQGHLERAVQMIQEMSSSDNSPVWLALLGACRKWGDVNVGRWAFEQVLQVDENDAAAYVLMSNIYAEAGMHITFRP